MQTVFEQIKDRLPITEVLATYLTLIPSGTQFKAKCPFHNERSASFSISPERGLYYCFGCGAKGDIFTFVEQFEGLDKKGALKVLADRAGVTLTNVFTARESSDPLYDVLEKSTTRYEHELARRPEIMEYLTARGLRPETISAFRIGYAPDEWRYIANTMTSEADAAIGERAGLTKKTPKGYYDRFRKRIMFPLTDASSRVVGFSGRLYPLDTDDDKQSPKYLNSPETELFQKSRILFGFDKAKAAIRQHNFAILVEGQFDAVLAHQAGFRNTVASSGTAVSEQSARDPTANLSVLARLTPNVFLAFDGDAAGQKALDRAALVALSLGMNPRVVPLPQGVDPADYTKDHGAEGWKSLLKQSEHFIVHQLRMINASSLSPNALEIALKARVFPYLARVVSPIEQGKYIESIGATLGIPPADILRELALVRAEHSEPRTVEPAPAQDKDIVTLDERFCAIAQRYPSTVSEALTLELRALSFESMVYKLPEISDERNVILTALAERDYGYLPEGERDMVLRELARKITEQFLLGIRAAYTLQLREAERAEDETTVQTIMSVLHTLNTRLQSGG